MPIFFEEHFHDMDVGLLAHSHELHVFARDDLAAEFALTNDDIEVTVSFDTTRSHLIMIALPIFRSSILSQNVVVASLVLNGALLITLPIPLLSLMRKRVLFEEGALGFWWQW